MKYLLFSIILFFTNCGLTPEESSFNKKWVSYYDTNGKFSVRMPFTPDVYHFESFLFMQGDVHFIRCRQHSMTWDDFSKFRIKYIDLPDTYARAQQFVFDSVVKYWKGIDAQVWDVHAINLGKYKGFAMKNHFNRFPRTIGIYRYYLVRRRLIELCVVPYNGYVADARIDSFFNSFTLYD